MAKRKYSGSSRSSYKKKRKTYKKKKKSYKKKKYKTPKISLKGLITTKRYNNPVTEYAVVASATSPAIRGYSPISNIPVDYNPSTAYGHARSTPKMVAKGFHLKMCFHNNQSHSMFARVIVALTRDVDSTELTAILNGTNVLEQNRDGVGEHKDDEPMVVTSASNIINMMYPPSKELFRKIYMNKVIRLGPAGGAGISEARYFRKFIKLNRVFKFSGPSATLPENGTIVVLVGAYDPTNDTTVSTIELTETSTFYWQDQIN